MHSANDERILMELDIEQIEPNPLQARGIITPESLVDLIASIKEHGLLEPIVVARTPAGFQIIAGERRWRASRVVGMKKIPVVIMETTARGMLELAIVENVQREDLNPIERGQAFQRLVDEFGLPLTDIAKRVGKSEGYVSNAIRLLNLPDAIKDGLISGAISEGHARAIAGLPDVKLMIDAYKTILSENTSVRAAEDLARKIKSEIRQPVRRRIEKIYSEELSNYQKKIGETYDAKVQIAQTKVQSRVHITFNGPVEKTTKQIRELVSKLIGEVSA